MKVAICISGMSRTFTRTAEQIKKHLIDPYKADVFISTWKPSFADPLWPDIDMPESMIDVFQPKKFDIEIYNEARQRSFETNNFKTRADWGGDAVHRIIPMYYKIYLANLHKSYYEWENNFTYDIVVRCRSDLTFHETVPLHPLKDLEAIFPETNSQWNINDQFWYCNSSTADFLASLYLNIPNLWHAGCNIHGETLLKNFIENIHVKCSLSNEIKYHIER